jgi:hypothetical protein
MESHDTTDQRKESPSRSTSRTRIIVGGIIALGLAAGAFWIAGPARQFGRRAAYAGRVATFSGKSEALKQTVIVPTLDSPCPPGKNVIWCSSFQLAWNELRDKVIGAPLQVIGAEEVAARLNEAKQSTADLERNSFYAAGGWIKDGIVGKIRTDMGAKFPSHVLPDFSGYTEGILAYSYLTAHVPFKYPFCELNNGLAFADSQGADTQVAGFGLWNAWREERTKIREQMEVLYCHLSAPPGRRLELQECAIDLCKYSQPYQIVLAIVEPNESLAQTLEYVGLRIRQSRSEAYYEARSRFEEIDVLQVPEMLWRIDYRFLELIGKAVANVGMPIAEAMQTIEFRLDRSGAEVENEGLMSVKAIPRHFVFNRPFLVYMQKRGAEQAFFVMWVDNAELLVRR